MGYLGKNLSIDRMRAFAGRLRKLIMNEPSSTPFNQQDSAFGDPIAAAEYDKQIFDSWIRQLERWVGRTDNLDILEVGPGISLGAQLLLVGRGNRVTVIDPYPPHWHGSFHPAVYRHLGSLVGGSELLQQSADAGTFDRIPIRRLVEPAHDLHSLRDSEFDVVLSNAVMEHVRELNRVCGEFARVTKTNGANIHQIDLGYHKNRDRPLDHLLMSEREFFAEAEAANFEYGNRWRASEFTARFQRAGFVVKNASVSQRADAAYVSEVQAQSKGLRRSYGLWPAEDLGVLSMLLVAFRVPTITSKMKGSAAVASQKMRKMRSRLNLGGSA